jgi:hypothetical protein
MDSFYHTLLSDASYGYFPNNTISNFVNHLHTPITLDDGLFEVALAKYSFVYSPPFIEKGTPLCTINQENKDRTLYATKDLHSMNDITTDIVQQAKFIEFTVEKNGKLSLEFDSGEYTTVSLDEKISAKLGFTLMERSVNGFKIVYTAMLDQYFDSGQTRMHVYTDIVKPQYVGDILAPLVLIENYDGKSGRPNTKSVDNLQYFDLASNVIDKIHVYIKSETGDNLPFKFGNFCAQFHFRRKRY